MVSNDLKMILQKIHTERYRVIHIETLTKRKDTRDDLDIETSITLEREDEKITLTTSEPDCIIYATKLRSIVQTDGELLFAPVKNTELYNQNIEFLTDSDHAKLNSASKDLQSGKFVFTYDPQKLVEELLESPPNIKSLRKTKFSPLFKDYYYILALTLRQCQRIMKTQKLFEKKNPETISLLTAIGQFFATFSLVTKNPIKNYRNYKGYVSFDPNLLFVQQSQQMDSAENDIKLLIAQRRVNWRIDIPKLINIYAGCLESSKPLINLLRVGLELKDGVKLPRNKLSLGENINILKSYPKYGSIFSYLDEQIRHGDAHPTIFVKGDKVEIRSSLARKSIVLRTYKCSELASMIFEMRQEFHPALVITVILNDFGLLLQVLNCIEYKLLIASLGNC